MSCRSEEVQVYVGFILMWETAQCAQRKRSLIQNEYVFLHVGGIWTREMVALAIGVELLPLKVAGLLSKEQ